MSQSENFSPVVFNHFSFRYSNMLEFALKNIHFNLMPGQVLFIAGPSGSGKSTLGLALCGQIPFKIRGQMKGEISLFGKDIWSYQEESLPHLVSIMLQNAEEQLMTFTVYDELAFSLENLCFPEEEITARIQQISKQFQIEALLSRSIHTLSGGEKQKVILAANLITDPKLLVLDEPLAFLDLNAEKNLISLLVNLLKLKPQMTIVIIEHRYGPFRDLIDSLLLLDTHGNQSFFGSISQFNQVKVSTEVPFFRDFTLLHNYNELTTQPQQFLSTTSPPQNNSGGSSIQKNRLIELQNLDFVYPNGHTVFNGLNFHIDQGEFLGIVGENGSGKTTLLYLLCNILRPSSGSIQYQGKNYESLLNSELYPKIGFIFQNPENQLFTDTVRAEILYGPDNFALSSKSDYDIPTTIHKSLQLIQENRDHSEIFAKRNPFCLSWGQKRRLNIASILSYNPELIILDEPFIGQDLHSINRILGILQECHTRGITILMVSHDLDVLEKNCSRIVSIPKYFPRANSNQVDHKEQGDQNEQVKLTKKVQKITSENKAKHSHKQMRLTQFLNDTILTEGPKNWLERLNPITKLVCLIVFTVMLFFQSSLILLSCFFIGELAIAFCSHLDIRALLRQMRWLVILTLIYIPLNGLFNASVFTEETILFYLWDPYFPVRRIAFYYALRTGLIIMILFSSTIIFNSTTSFKALVYSLIQLKIPYRYAFAFMIGLRYVPIIQHETSVIEIAQELRGFGLQRKNHLVKIFEMLGHRITTLLISIFRKAHNTALSIESRGFGQHSGRTNLTKIRITRGDLLIPFAMILIFVMILLYNAGAFQLPAIPSLLSLISPLL